MKVNDKAILSKAEAKSLERKIAEVYEKEPEHLQWEVVNEDEDYNKHYR